MIVLYVLVLYSSIIYTKMGRSCYIFLELTDFYCARGKIINCGTQHETNNPLICVRINRFDAEMSPVQTVDCIRLFSCRLFSGVMGGKYS